MNHTLFTFYNNVNERETVKAFMVEVLKELTVTRAFDGKPVTGIQEARELINTMFDKLDELYGKVEEPKVSNSR